MFGSCMAMSAHVDWPIWQLVEALGVRLSLDFFLCCASVQAIGLSFACVSYV